MKRLVAAVVVAVLGAAVSVWGQEAAAFFYAPTDRTTVRGVLAKRIKESRGPVYNYLFAYEAPVNGGITPFHCAELIYVFHNVDLPELRLATGGGPSARRVQDAGPPRGRPRRVRPVPHDQRHHARVPARRVRVDVAGGGSTATPGPSGA